MLIAVNAWELRETARLLLATGNYERALEIARRAQELERTDNGDALVLLSSWLAGRPEPSEGLLPWA